MPRSASSLSTAGRSKRPSCTPTDATCALSPRGGLALGACRYSVGASPSRTRPRATVARPGSSTTRSGATNARPASGPLSPKRTVNDGSSASTVPAPVRIAPARARHFCTSRREASPLIHFDSPLASALRPSRLVASLIRSHGRPRSIRDSQPRLSVRACAAIRPDSTPMPAASRRVNPAPSTCGNGSRIAPITRTTPAAINASAHGPVLPVCAQGSSVT